MTNDEFAHLMRKIIKEEIIAEREHTRKLVREEIQIEIQAVRIEIQSSEKRLKEEFNRKITELTEHMAKYFHKTWVKMDETNERVTIIEDHLDLPHPAEN